MILGLKDDLFRLRVAGRELSLKESHVKSTSLLVSQKEADIKMVADSFMTEEKFDYHTYIHLRDGKIKQAVMWCGPLSVEPRKEWWNDPPEFEER